MANRTGASRSFELIVARTKIKKGYLEKSGENIAIIILDLKYCKKYKRQIIMANSTGAPCSFELIVAWTKTIPLKNKKGYLE